MKKTKGTISISLKIFIIILIIAIFIMGFIFFLKLRDDGYIKESKLERNIRNKEIGKDAKEYMKQKYNIDFEIEDISNIGDIRDGGFMDKGQIITFIDGTKCVYDNGMGYPGRQTFYDNYQSEIIIKDIKEKILQPTVNQIEDEDTTIIALNDMIFSAYLFDNYTPQEQEAFFSEYYDGDIFKYLTNNKLRISAEKDVYIICEEKSKGKEKINYFLDMIEKYFCWERDSYSNLYVLNKECFDKITSYQFYSKANIGLEGCFYEVVFPSNTLYSVKEPTIYEQNFIKIVDGIYATIYKSDYKLAENDIIFKEVDISTIKNTSDYTYGMETPLWEIILSDRIKEDFKEEKTCKIYFCIKENELKKQEKQYLKEKTKDGYEYQLRVDPGKRLYINDGMDDEFDEYDPMSGNPEWLRIDIKNYCYYGEKYY